MKSLVVPVEVAGNYLAVLSNPINEHHDIQAREIWGEQTWLETRVAETSGSTKDVLVAAIPTERWLETRGGLALQRWRLKSRLE